MPDSVKLLSRAKINLTLDVSRLRPDGFHEIDSVVSVIDLCDEIVVTKARRGIEVAVQSGDAPAGAGNLVYRAAEVFFKEVAIDGGAHFVLRKQVPAQAGLGGGSANAAAAIAALNRIYDTGLSQAEMCAMAARVGSDAALFIIGGTARMRGRGEIVEPLPDAPELDLVMVKPEAGVSTVWAYAQLDRRDRVCGRGSDRAEEAVRSGDRAALLEALANDFDAVLSAAIPEIAQARQALLDAGAKKAVLCGSGSAVFGVFESKDTARRAAKELRARFACVFACRTLSRAESALA
jgi:4-diphosphocytidyl-2-C-methyl-D-erythritol kinase